MRPSQRVILRKSPLKRQKPGLIRRLQKQKGLPKAQKPRQEKGKPRAFAALQRHRLALNANATRRKVPNTAGSIRSRSLTDNSLMKLSKKPSCSLFSLPCRDILHKKSGGYLNRVFSPRFRLTVFSRFIIIKALRQSCKLCRRRVDSALQAVQGR